MLLLSLHTRCSFLLVAKPSGCRIKTSSRVLFKNAVVTSIWWSFWTESAKRARRNSCLTSHDRAERLVVIGSLLLGITLSYQYLATDPYSSCFHPCTCSQLSRWKVYQVPDFVLSQQPHLSLHCSFPFYSSELTQSSVTGLPMTKAALPLS